MVGGIPQAANHYLQGRTVMFDFRKMAVSLSVLSITAATTTTLASAQEAALSEGATRACGVFGKMPRRRQGM